MGQMLPEITTGKRAIIALLSIIENTGGMNKGREMARSALTTWTILARAYAATLLAFVRGDEVAA